ncbi:stress response translation initiation inhibitor YciH [Candidatus Nanohalococcus occultus]|uniref:Translation initiation factor 1 (eIF-1/SUI1) n=1 Tax=Candidatus Nanohalococcus occultus TaxID=2978047 RepID=A0ABY8CJR5_9ARCH|nr:Translation initiation factor 1 (eIF-1/SUI1) [Candidatus Nanohaloarchaeota archaeon SVXNc]
MPDVPDEFDPFDQVSKADQKIEVYIDTRSYNKEMTIISGFDENVDLDDLSSKLKTKVAAGGTVKDGNIELQGNHLHRIEDILAEEGFDNVEVQR